MARAPGNGYPATVVKGFVKEIETLEAEATDIRFKAMQKIEKIKEQQGDIYDAAKEKGIPRKALRTVIKVRQAEAKVEKLRNDLEEDEQDSFDLLRLALGDLEDTELGKAAMARMAERKKEEESAIDDIGRGKPN
jgi:uncharacterized protein (UPF0335 family)